MKSKKILCMGVLVVLGALFVLGCQKKEVGGEPFKGSVEEIQKEQGKSDPSVVNFSLVSPDHPVVVGENNKVTLEIKSKNGLKINHDFPWKVRFKSQDNLTVSEQELTPEQFEMSEKSVKMTIDVKPSDAGTFDLEGVGTFSVCSVQLCDVRRNEPLLFTLVAEPAA